MRRIYEVAPQRKVGPRETCDVACGNMNCQLNIKNVPKGERFTVISCHRTKRCSGYQEPRK